MDRLESMSLLVAAADAGSLSAASRQLRIPLATVSRKISELETRLRARLLLRGSRRLSLTDAGEAYVAACRRVLADIEEADRRAAGEYAAPRGELTISAPAVFGRMHVLPVGIAFLEANPEIDIRLGLTDRVANLLDEPIDVAVRIGELPDSGLVAGSVGAVTYLVCASPAYLARRGAPETPADLSRHDCITFEGLGSPKVWRFVRGPKAEDAPIHSRLIAGTAEAACDAATASLGIARLVSYQAADALRSGRLVTVLDGFDTRRLPVSLIHAGRSPLPLKLRAFLDFAAPRLGARLRDLPRAGYSAAARPPPKRRST